MVAGYEAQVLPLTVTSSGAVVLNFTLHELPERTTMGERGTTTLAERASTTLGERGSTTIDELSSTPVVELNITTPSALPVSSACLMQLPRFDCLLSVWPYGGVCLPS